MAVLILVLHVGGALVAGAAFARYVDEGLSSVERLTTAFMLGNGALGLTIFLVGLVSLNPWTVLSVFSLAYLPLLSKRVRSWLAESMQSVGSGFTRPMLAHLLLLGILFLAAVPRPTGGLETDNIRYHLAGASVWVRTGRIVPVLDSALTAFPALIESLFSAGMALSNDRFPAMLGITFAAVVVAEVYGFSRLLGSSKRAATLMSFLAACAPAITEWAPSGYVDLAYAAYALVAARLLLVDTLSYPRAAIGGLLLGFALGVKYNALTLVPITVVVAFLAGYRQVPVSVLVGRISVVLGVATLVGSPFYIKNAILLGTPIYPPPVLLTHFFQARAFPVEATIALQHWVRETGIGFGRNVVDLLALPWRYTLFTERFGGPGGVGVAPLALGAFGAAVAWSRRPARVFLCWMGLVTITWFLIQQESRFLLHVISLSFAFSAVGMIWLEREWPRLGRATIALVALVSAVYGLSALFHLHKVRIHAAFSRAAAEKLRETWVPYLSALEYVNRDTSVRRVLILDSRVPPFYLSKDYVKIVGGWGELPISGIVTGNEALAHLNELGVTHIFDVISPQMQFQVTPRADLRAVFRSDSARVYEVILGDGAGDSSVPP